MPSISRTPPIEIGVYPPESTASYERIFSALCRAFPVRFTSGTETVLTSCQAVVILEPNDLWVRTCADADIPTFSVENTEQRRTITTSEVKFGDTSHVDSRLRSRILTDGHISHEHVMTPGPKDVVLATAGADPVWVARGNSNYRVSIPLQELKPHEVLRHQLQSGRFMHLLPLVAFLREVCTGTMWTPPPLRACFIVDDPNLHHVTYGHLDFRILARHSEQHNYHVSMATIPLDGWWINQEAATLFRSNPHRLSLSIHGNDHVHHELERAGDTVACRSLLGQALDRIDSLEQKAGVSVSRVMVPPHGRISQNMIRAMVDMGPEALCGNRPYLWLDTPPAHQLLAGWHPADLVDSGYPVIPRFHLTSDTDEIYLRAYLNHPLVMYGHHTDLALGMDLLERTAARINTLPDVQWMSLESISRSNMYSRMDNGTLHIRPLSCRMQIQVPDSIREVHIHTQNSFQGFAILEGNQYYAGEDGTIRITHQMRGKPLDLRMQTFSHRSHESIPRPRRRLWPILRRMLTEARDRAQPFVQKLGG